MTHNNTIIFRFVVNNDSGLGHFFRCLNTARKLIANYNITFIIDNKSDISLVKKNKLLPYSIIQLPELNSISEEHSYLKKIIKGYNVKWFITDICTNNLLETDRDYLNRYHTSLKNSFDIKIISFEDFRINLFSSDCAVVWNAKDNHQKNHRGHKTLYGLKYFICSPEMTILSKVERTINKNGKRLLIFISGSCNNNPTETLVEYFKEKIPNGIYVRIICSKSNYGASWERIRELCESKEMYFEFFDINDQIYDHLIWADLAIVGEGLIKYEAAILGTPAIQISTTDQRNKALDDYKNWNCSIVINSIDKIKIYDCAMDLLNNFRLRKEFWKNGKKNIDGYGFKRIFCDELNIIKNEEYGY